MAASAGIRASGSHDDIALEPELYPQQDEQPIETAEGTAYCRLTVAEDMPVRVPTADNINREDVAAIGRWLLLDQHGTEVATAA